MSESASAMYTFLFWFFLIKVDPIVLIVLKHKYLVSFVLFLTEISARLSSLLKLETKFPDNRMVLFVFSQIQMCLMVEHEGGKNIGPLIVTDFPRRLLPSVPALS